MSNLQKAALTVNGNSIHVAMPFAKVNEEKRTVSGYATLDNIDTQGDVVLAEASKKAFERARGNLREMHQPIAVGKVIDFREDEFYDSETGDFYRGIYVTARISKGAESTWEKVLDGTLTGFSIGGEVIDQASEFVKDAGKSVRFIKDYDLVELSLVDNPANQLANVFSIQKAANGSVTGITGMVADTPIENVFFCKEDVVIQAKSEESTNCPECGNKMQVIGWFENTGNRAEKVREIANEYLAVDTTTKGGVEMAKNKEVELDTASEDETVRTGHEAGDETEVPTPAEDATTASADVDETAGTDDEVQKAADVEEVHDDQSDIFEKIDELKVVVNDSLVKFNEEAKQQVAGLENKIEEIQKSFESQVSELDKKMSGYGERLETTKSKLAGLEKALEKFNSAEALKKSADLDNPVSDTKKNDNTAWNGAFSVDNVL